MTEHRDRKSVIPLKGNPHPQVTVPAKDLYHNQKAEDLRNALGQFIIYKSTLEDIEPDRILYLVVRSRTYQEIFAETIGATPLRTQKQLPQVKKQLT
jgi:hypothetical protein